MFLTNHNKIVVAIYNQEMKYVRLTIEDRLDQLTVFLTLVSKPVREIAIFTYDQDHTIARIDINGGTTGLYPFPERYGYSKEKLIKNWTDVSSAVEVIRSTNQVPIFDFVRVHDFHFPEPNNNLDVFRRTISADQDFSLGFLAENLIEFE